MYLAFGGSHFGKHGLGNLGSPHLLLDLLIDGAADMEHRAWTLQLRPHRRHPGLQGERGAVKMCTWFDAERDREIYIYIYERETHRERQRERERHRERQRDRERETERERERERELKGETHWRNA